MSTECPNCGKSFSKIGTHWNHNGYPDIDHLEESLIGMSLGDGSFDNCGGYSRMRIIMTNKPFIKWYRDKLGWFGTDIRVHRTAEEATKVGESLESNGNFKEQYVVSTRNHPDLSEMHETLQPNNKTSVNESIKLSWESLKFWYISDGTYEFSKKAANPRISIAAGSYVDNETTIHKMFTDLPIEPRITTDRIRFSVDDSGIALTEMEPVPGFEYKWGIGIDRNP